jgi:hypothetical protein
MNRAIIAELAARLTELFRRTPLARMVPYHAEAPLKIRRATRKPYELRLPAPAQVATDSLSVLLQDRASK